MKLERLVLTAIMLAALSSACANGATESPARGGASAGAVQNGTGAGGEGGAGSGADAGAYSSTTPDSGNPYSTPDTGSVTPTDAGVTPPFDSGAATDVGTVTSCGAMGTMSACAECCVTLNPTGVTTLNAAIQACACGATGVCATECASEVCVDIPATSGDACYACLSAALGTSGACYTSVQTTCVADPGCSSYLSCETSECSGKP